MRSEQDIRRLMRSGMEQETGPRRAMVAVGRARRQVGQRDSLAFALVRIWAVLARLLAPLFAAFSERQAQAIHQHSSGQKKLSADDQDQKGENND
ncbi:MAG: hypothetical protein K0U72_17365 [Gammaproteobacteria bacterium]|nr:hypothetical protein [Gammaproteobacteria bacterium]